MEKYKENLLNNLRSHIETVTAKIGEKLELVKKFANMSLSDVRKMPQSDQMVYMDLRVNAKNRIGELAHLKGSPYFTKCKILDENGNKKDYYFAKHEFSEESIYSWVAPVATIRFENPGVVSYKIPDGTNKTLTILEKEQYMIVDGKVIFYAQETKDKPRDLIYQEHFTKQKSEFALPEIVAQMEKAQDQVIRAGHTGPLVISGPAGSGKTTLALHRVAYLTQAPDTAPLYPSREIVVFVQDTGTKNYFSTLLPGLGIHDVQITTFSSWAFSILGLYEYEYIERYGENDEEKDLYEYQKLRALREGKIPQWSVSHFSVLLEQYQSYFSAQGKKMFSVQQKTKSVDRFDLTILLQVYYKKYKKFEVKREYKTYVKDRLVSKTEKKSIIYPLMIVDEFQNYLPEQLKIFLHCLSGNTKSSVYVGDIAQQVRLGTIKEWNEIGETILSERNIRLNKVYRNTKNILLFIQSLGYTIELPVGLKEGPHVVEKITQTIDEEIIYIKNIISAYEKGTVGILAKEELYLTRFKETFKEHKNIHVLTMAGSQGVEFDLVVIVGVHKDTFQVVQHVDVLPRHLEERKRMQKDLLYVALTRAITELHVLGLEKLKDIL